MTNNNNDNERTLKTPPNSFVCPLTLEVMVDPVLDTEGNTFERKALLCWLTHYGVSPVSREPLNLNLVIPNIALRDTIHEMMGLRWVGERTEEVNETYRSFEQQQKNEEEKHQEGREVPSSSSSSARRSKRYRQKMQCYLQRLSEQISGGSTSLNFDANGVCLFYCEGMQVVIEVPPDVGFFFIYTTIPVPHLSEKMKDTLLEMNRLQHETRGGSLSVHKYPSGVYDIYFSYSDRIDEISSADFCNIIPNFIDISLKLRHKFIIENSSSRVTGDRLPAEALKSPGDPSTTALRAQEIFSPTSSTLPRNQVDHLPLSVGEYHPGPGEKGGLRTT